MPNQRRRSPRSISIVVSFSVEGEGEGEEEAVVEEGEEEGEVVVGTPWEVRMKDVNGIYGVMRNKKSEIRKREEREGERDQMKYDKHRAERES